MIKNIGNIDRIIRVSLAILIGVLYFLNIISGTTAIVLGVLAIVFVATSFMRFCPLYLPFKINTNKEK